MYFILPVWLLAGCADWLCHRATHIETTSGAKESMLHLLLFAEIGLPLLAAIFLQINAGIIAFMIVAFVLHQATSLWDVSYAVTVREVTPVEQQVHSFLEMLPLMAILLLFHCIGSSFRHCSASALKLRASNFAGRKSRCRQHMCFPFWGPVSCSKSFLSSRSSYAGCGQAEGRLCPRRPERIKTGEPACPRMRISE